MNVCVCVCVWMQADDGVGEMSWLNGRQLGPEARLYWDKRRARLHTAGVFGRQERGHDP